MVYYGIEIVILNVGIWSIIENFYPNVFVVPRYLKCHGFIKKIVIGEILKW